MIPIGAPVTITWGNGEKEPGILYKHGLFDTGAYVKLGIAGIECGFCYRDIKIRYDNAAPFTLWQLNAIIHYPANDWFWMGTNIEYGARCLMAVVTRSVN